MRRFEIPRSSLIEALAAKSWDKAQVHSRLVFNRRSFLAGSGLVLATLSSAEADDLVVEKEGKRYVVKLGILHWAIDPELFEQGAAVEYRWVDRQGRKHSDLSRNENADRSSVLEHHFHLKGARYPGISIRADLRARLYRRNSQWHLSIGFAEAKWSEIELPFALWATSAPTARQNYRQPYRGAPIVVGNINNKNNRIEPVRNPGLFEINSHFEIRLSQPLKHGEFSFSSKRLDFFTRGFRIQISDSPVRWAPDGAVKPYSHLAFDGVRFRNGQAPLGRIDRKLDACLEYDACQAELLGFRLRGTRPLISDALIRLSGDGALVVTGPGTGPSGSRVQLDSWVILGRANGLDHSIRFAGWVARRAHAVEGNCVSVVIQGDEHSKPLVSPIELTFDRDEPVRVVFESHLLAAHVPVLGVSTAEITFAKRIVRTVIGRAEQDKTAPALERNDALFYVGPQGAQFDSKLDDATLRITRSTDLLDLRFTFRRYHLKVDGGISKLKRSTKPQDKHKKKQEDDDKDRSLLIVNFPPQHLLEQAFKFSGEKAPQPECGATPPKDKHCYVEPPRVPLTDAKLALTRISGPTRIVFTEKADEVPGGAVLSVNYLTDWSQLATIVNDRALPRTARLTDQLKRAEIEPGTDRPTARRKILAKTSAPSPEETSIEAVYRLLVSPDESARWITPRTTPHPAAPVQWTAELDSTVGTSVRALWARDMDLSFLNVEKDLKIEPAQFLNNPCFVASLNKDDRFQLAAMMSIYGLAALRRLAVDAGGNYTGRDDPNGMVFLPSETYDALDPATLAPIGNPQQQIKQEGFVFAKPFDTFQLRLSRAGSVNAKWIGEPPSPWGLPDNPEATKPRFFQGSFSIEKYIHRTLEGRDTFVEVTYKGFLFPIGHRAALLKITQREFWPENLKPDGPPVAYLVQRRYIVVRQPEKLFPAYGQPFSSHDFPARKVTIKTVQTPDLADPKPITWPTPLPEDKCRNQDAVFWPRLEDTGQDVLFEYTVDDGMKVTSPLLFVNNVAAHESDTMRDIVAYYMGLPAADLLAKEEPNPNRECFLRFAKLFEAPRRYAEETKKGECTFKTASWVLGARGRLAGDESQYFAMDAFMEGRDQPPFYPVVSKARITADKVDRLVGVPNTAIEVAYNTTFVRNGLDPTANPTEIFLDVLQPDIQFDPANDTRSTGGVATTNSLLVAFGRKTGLIGGTRRGGEAAAAVICNCRSGACPVCPACGGSPAQTLLPVVPSPTLQSSAVAFSSPPALPPNRSPYHFVAAAMGRFDPIEAFAGAKRSAKLLGCVSMTDILRGALMAAAPKLVEQVNYGVDTARETLGATLNDVKAEGIRAGEKIARFLTDMEAEANRRLVSLGGAGMNLRTLYPEFVHSLDAVKVTIGKIEQTRPLDFTRPGVLTADSAQMMFGLATEFIAAVEAVVDEIRRLARDPMPTVVQSALAEIQQRWDELRNLVADPKDAIKKLIDDLIGPGKIFDLLCDKLIENELFEVLFGYLGSEDFHHINLTQPLPRELPDDKREEHKKLLREQCRRIFNNPAAVIPRLQEALFYELFAEPFVKMVGAAQRLYQDASGIVTWSRTALAERISGILRLGVAEAQAQEFPKYAWNVIADMEAAVPEILVSRPLDQILPAIETAARNSVQRQIAALQTDLEAWKKAADEKVEAAKKLVATRAAAIVDEETERLYQDALAELMWFQKLVDAYEELRVKYEALKTAPAQLDKLAREVRAAAEQEIRSAIARLEDQLREHAKAGATGLAGRLLAVVRAVLDSAAQSAAAKTIALIGDDITGICGNFAERAVGLVQDLSVGLIAPAKTVQDRAKEVVRHLEAITDQLKRLHIPNDAPQDVREVVVRLRAALTRSLQQIAALLLEFEKVRHKVDTLSRKPANMAEYCLRPAVLLDLPARCIDLRRRVGNSILDALTQTVEALDALKLLGDAMPPAPPPDPHLAGTYLQPFAANATDLKTSLEALASVLGGMVAEMSPIGAISQSPANASWKAVKEKAIELREAIRTSAPTAKKALDDVTSALQPFLDLEADPNHPIRRQLKATYTPDEALKLAKDIVEFTGKFDRRLPAVLLQASLPAGITTTIFEQAAASLEWVTEKLIPIHEDIETALTKVISIAESAPLLNLIGHKIIDRIKIAQTLVTTDKDRLKALQTSATAKNPEDVAQKLQVIVDDWSTGNVGLIQALQIAKTIVETIASGNFAALIDIAVIERQLRDEIKALLPTRITLNYNFDSELSDYPAGKPIFSMNRESFGFDGPADENETIRNDLDLRTRISVDLLTGDRDVSAIGFIRPFRIHLLGSVDLATIYFRGARFETKGGTTKFNADIADVKIGTALAFLKAIQEFIAPSSGNGFYRRITFREIEVGYRFSKDLITVGALQLHNVGFGIGALLPIDGRQAEFRFTFASREKPFLIVYPPYGGGGFLGLRANARGIIAFEIQLEFGAVVGIEFGPLKGTARITAGIYLLLAQGGRRVLEGFVQAVGEGNIMCFSIAVLIQVKTTQQSDSSMQGSSTYSVSIKVSFAELKYGFTAAYKTQGGSGSGSADGSVEGRTNPMLIAGAAPTARRAKPKPKEFVRRKIITVAPPKHARWDRYRKYCDI